MSIISEGVKALVMRQDKTLILVEPNGRFDLPGGRVEDGERLSEALKREVSEETGLGVEILGPCSTWSFMKNPELLITGVTFYCKYTGGEVVLGEEHVRYFWCELDKLHGLGLQRYLLKAIWPSPEGIRKAGRSRAGRPGQTASAKNSMI
jgi:ADP-ribose pyrophosphatase YjhB (NUDIX family)